MKTEIFPILDLNLPASREHWPPLPEGVRYLSEESAIAIFKAITRNRTAASRFLRKHFASNLGTLRYGPHESAIELGRMRFGMTWTWDMLYINGFRPPRFAIPMVVSTPGLEPGTLAGNASQASA